MDELIKKLGEAQTAVTDAEQKLGEAQTAQKIDDTAQTKEAVQTAQTNLQTAQTNLQTAQNEVTNAQTPQQVEDNNIYVKVDGLTYTILSKNEGENIIKEEKEKSLKTVFLMTRPNKNNCFTLKVDDSIQKKKHKFFE